MFNPIINSAFMRISFFTLAVFSAIILLSCQKELSDPNGTTTTKEERKLLVKATYDQVGITLIDSFVYDNDNRCTRYLENIYDLSSGPDPYVYFYDFHYNGNDTLPYKITDTSEGRELIWLILYDAQHRKIADSILSFPLAEKLVCYYSYSASRIIATNTYSRNGIVMGTGKDTFDIDGNNCISEATSTGRALYTYDNAINPFTTMNIDKAVWFGATGILGDFQGLNRNNLIKVTSGNTVNFQYTYDAGRYPITAAYSVVGQPDLNGTIEYKYNK